MVTDTKPSIRERIAARAAGAIDQVTEDRLTAWIAADRATGAPEWSDADRIEAREWLRAHPDFQPFVLELQKFGTLKGLRERYHGLLERLGKMGKLSAEAVSESRRIAGSYSVAGLMAEGKMLRDVFLGP
jgi:hypothetical protein